MRRLARTPPEQVWADTDLDDEALRRRLSVQVHIAKFVGDPDRLRFPPAIVERILSGLIDKLRRAATSPEDRRAIIDLNRVFKRWRATLPRRPNHRPRTSPLAYEAAVFEFAERRWQLINRRKRRRTPAEATKEAARATALCYGVSPATILTWVDHPGRRPAMQRLRRFRERHCSK
jgi:hypothetical protein